ncbi:MAG: thiol:disulfide interchange protein DsbA/DsbL [Pseudomonadota bacterium]|nr:thiol:disulfide interchange protein DsbA/DsbL [Pseudomonadota bacterium]
MTSRLALLLALFLLSMLLSVTATAATAAGPAPVAGTDYVEIADGQPFAPQAGKIEVVEIFGYTCPHCANFQPVLAPWKARLPADVQFTSLAAPFGGYWIPYARAYYAARTLGLLERTHGAMFRALHDERRLPLSRPTPQEIAGFYAGYGAEPQRFMQAMADPSIDAEFKRVNAFIQRSGVEGTPTLIVNGKYRVLGNSFQDTLRITGQLVARERAARDRAARNR